MASWRASRAANVSNVRHLCPIPGPIPSQVKESIHSIPISDGTSIRARVYQPVTPTSESDPNAGNGRPLIILIHEGGWSMGDLSDEDHSGRLFTRDLHAVCVNVEYRLAPEDPFPTGVEDCWTALNWAIAHAEELDASPATAGLILGGSSAGSNIAAVLALRARDKQLSPPVTGQWLSVPALLPSSAVPERFKHLFTSRRENKSDPVLQDLNEVVLEAIYKPEAGNPLWNPFAHPDGQRGVAKAFFQVAGMDPLRDDGVLYDRVLREQGVLTRFELYEGYGHMFWTNYPELERSKEFWRDALKGVRWLLEK